MTDHPSAAQPGPPILDYPIVDVDVHLHETASDLVEFADGTLRELLELATGPERWLDTPGYSPMTMYEPPIGVDPLKPPYQVRTPDQMRADLDRLGIAAAVMHPGRFLTMSQRWEPHYPANMLPVYNRYLREKWLDPARGLYGSIFTVMQDPIASAREIERHADHRGFAAVYAPLAAVFPLWGHRQYNPVFAAAEAANLPIIFQGYTLVYPAFPYQLDYMETALAKQAIAQPFGAAAHLASMIGTGVLARYPNLRVVFTECGVGWLPPLLWRLDEQWRHLRHETPFYTEPPSHYVRRQVYVTTHCPETAVEPAAWAALIDGAGLRERVVFASDWPHYDADPPDRLRNLPIDADLKRRILSENGHTVLRLANLPGSG